jgi:hypothetical protein
MKSAQTKNDVPRDCRMNSSPIFWGHGTTLYNCGVEARVQVDVQYGLPLTCTVTSVATARSGSATAQLTPAHPLLDGPS